MTHYLVPVDFSDISINAALFAAEMAKNCDAAEIVLFHASEPSEVGIDGTPVTYNPDTHLELSKKVLENIQTKLFMLESIPIQSEAVLGNLEELLKAKIVQYNANLLVMGISGQKDFMSGFTSSHALNVAETDKVPVLIVPPESKYKNSKKIAVVVALKDTAETISYEPLKGWLESYNPEIHFLHINETSLHNLTAPQEQEFNLLYEMFSKFNCKFHQLHSKDFAAGVNKFVDANDIEMAVIFPKKHNFFAYLFSTTHTEKLAFHSHVPVLIAHHT